MTRCSAVFGGTSYHDFKKVEEQGSLMDAHPKRTLVTGNSGVVAFWEAWGPPMPAKPCTSRAMPSGRCSAQTVIMPPIFGQNPGNSKTDVCYLPSTHAMTNFPLSYLRLKKLWCSPLHPSNRHIVVGHDWPHIIVRPSFSHKKPKGCFRQ